MSKKQQIKNATNRVQRNKTAIKKSNTNGFWKKVWDIICWPCRMIVRAAKWFWKWLCTINVVGLINLTLLLAIIVLFSMLIVDFTKCNAQTVVMNPNTMQTQKTSNTKRNVVPRPVKPIANTLPMVRDTKTHEVINEPIVVAYPDPCPMQTRHIARMQTENKILGDVVIDSRAAATTIEHNTKIQGNLYLQNMRKYILPCGVRIDGDLYLRDVRMLQFCGEFTVTGNIYVSPRSSFGPIPGTARLGGQIIF